ncbi:MAG: hypothetical protein JXA82_19550 [Sedimentisphaerales bacterium]|nr:hypothetical protein [Sedimentisphaerales bacterium]
MVTRCGKTWILSVAVISLLFSTGQADWMEDFEGDLTGWQWGAIPNWQGTFTHEILEEPDGNHYLVLQETMPYTDVMDPGSGSAFGIGFGDPEVFTDVCVGAIVNVTGEASINYHGLAGRAVTTEVQVAPGVVLLLADAYILHINWEDGPVNLSINIEKVIQNQNIMRQGFQAAVPGYIHRRSYYAELDILGSDPTYVTGRLYEYKGGPLVAQVGPMIDTAGNDPWEDPDEYDAPFLNGMSGIFAQNEHADPVGYFTTFDDVYSTSVGPSAISPVPVDGAEGVGLEPTLHWTEGTHATGRQLWFGPIGAMTMVSPDSTDYSPGILQAGQTYNWRVDQVGSEGRIVTGQTWSFSTIDCLVVDDFESYADDEALQSAWDPNSFVGAPPDPNSSNYLDTDMASQGNKSMRLKYQNITDPFTQEFTRVFDSPQDWTAYGIQALTLAFHGRKENVEQPLFVYLQDQVGVDAKVEIPQNYAVRADEWNDWDINLADFEGVDLSAIAVMIIGVGGDDTVKQSEPDEVNIDYIRLYQARCFNSAGLDLYGDLNGDCVVNMEDVLVLARGWLNNGMSVTP